MKNVSITLIIYISLLISVACTNRTKDNIFCQGACPNNLKCDIGVCGCPDGFKQIGDFCFVKIPNSSAGPGVGYFLEIDTNDCGIPNHYFQFDLNPEWTSFRDTNTFSFFGDEGYNMLPITQFAYEASQSNTQGNYSKGNDSLYRFGAYQNNINYGPCASCTPVENNILRLKGYFNKGIDTVTMFYYFSCCNGAIKDTCVKQFALLK